MAQRDVDDRSTKDIQVDGDFDIPLAEADKVLIAHMAKKQEESTESAASAAATTDVDDRSTKDIKVEDYHRYMPTTIVVGMYLC